MFGRCGRPALVSIHAPSLHVHGAPRKLCAPGPFGQAGQAVGLCRLGRGPGRNSRWLRSRDRAVGWLRKDLAELVRDEGFSEPKLPPVGGSLWLAARAAGLEQLLS